MKSLKVSLGRKSYPIFIATDSLGKIPEMLRLYSNIQSVVVVTDRHVAKLFAGKLLHSLADEGLRTFEIVLPPGEKTKSLSRFEKIITQMLQHGVGRDWGLLALGGGVVGDIAGFVAASYMRGIPFVNVPTTLLAQVDASIGGKVGVNHPLAKNIIGAFYQPKFVWIDPSVLRHLDARQVLCGLAEIVKHGVIYDREFYNYCEQYLPEMIACHEETLEETIYRSAGIKAEIVGKDEFESGERAILNFGHTLGHAIEKVLGYGRILHGEAVFWGMLAEARLAAEMNLFPQNEFERLQGFLLQIPLKATIEGINFDDILNTIRHDKKVAGGRYRFALPVTLGKAKIVDGIQEEIIRDALYYASNRGWRI